MTAQPHCEPPTRLATFLEVRAPLDWSTVLLRAPSLAFAPRGDGRPVVLLPGYGTDEYSMRPLAKYLRFLGYDVHDWGLGRNLGKVEEYIHRMSQQARLLSADLGGQKLTLIGWSLGGVIARETARLEAPSVREVITMGTPVIGGPKYTAVASKFEGKDGLNLDELEREIHERNSIGFSQPVTSIYSKLDGVVGWRASVDTYNQQARNIQVNCSHFGLGINGRVWRIIADTLGENRS